MTPTATLPRVSNSNLPGWFVDLPRRASTWLPRQFSGWLLAALCLGGLMLTGCGSTVVDREWGAHAYPGKYSSVNGLGYLEKLCVQKGARFKEVHRLSPRLERTDCLILIADTMHPPAKEARDWMEEWLAAKTGRTIVLFGRDFDAAEVYLQETLHDQPTEKQVRARLDLAEIRVLRDDVLFEQMSDDHFCRWFYVRTSKPQRTLEKFRGPWSEQLTGQLKWPVRSYFDVCDPELRSQQPTWANLAKNTSTFRIPRAFRAGRRVPMPPATPPANNPNRNVFTSYWIPDDIGDAEEWEEEWDMVPEAEPLLVGDDGTPLVMRLASEDYPGSQIITLANAAPLFNGMMVNEDMRTLCMRIADTIGEGRVAYLPYNEGGIQVSHIPDSEDEVAGLSVLMTWPLNILMAHLAFLGVLICIALFPILGRPQNLKDSNLSDFGQHAEAMGQMLQGTRDLPFALKLVADYLRVVRGEALPGWLQSEIALHAGPDSLHFPAATPPPLPPNASGSGPASPAS